MPTCCCYLTDKEKLLRSEMFKWQSHKIDRHSTNKSGHNVDIKIDDLCEVKGWPPCRHMTSCRKLFSTELAMKGKCSRSGVLDKKGFDEVFVQLTICMILRISQMAVLQLTQNVWACVSSRKNTVQPMQLIMKKGSCLAMMIFLLTKNDNF